MRFAVIGVGGVGGYFGARLVQHGHEVIFVARGDNLRALQSSGLSVQSPEGDCHLDKIIATDTPDDMEPVDVVLVAVKGWQLQDTIPLIKPLLREDTAVVPLLNGVEAAGILSQSLEEHHVLGGLCGIIAHLDGPGRIKHIGIKPFIKIGELNNQISPRLTSLSAALEEAGVVVEIPADITRAQWLKFIFIASLSGVGAVTRSTGGVVRTVEQTREMLKQAISEAVAVGCSVGVALRSSDIENTLKAIDNIPADGTTSMQRDIEAGKPSELESQTGALVRLGFRGKVSTPVNSMIYAALLPQEIRARGDK